jgi:SAM-dependent methyltransferase
MRWIWYLAAAIWVLDALRMRVRIKSIPVVPPADHGDTTGYGVVNAAATVDDRTRAAAAAFARRERIGLIDLIPADTPALLAIGTVQLIDPAAYRTNPIAKGHSTGFALLAEEALFARAGVVPETRTDPAGLVEAAQRLKTFAVNRATLAIAPTLHASGNPIATWRSFSAIVGRASRFVLAVQGVMLAFVAVGLWAAPSAALTALLILHLQPLLVFAGLPIRPRDLGLTVLLRTPLDLVNWLRLLRSLIVTPAETPEMAALSKVYTDQLTDGLEHFFEPRREACPLCLSSKLRPHIHTTDLIQHKPGTFTLDRCDACGHIFQNPRLSVAGLDFYYGDFYDGLGTAVTEALMGAPLELYLTRARIVETLATPSRWLDVGTAHGHFCCAAQQAWPAARFDGLDISRGIEQAERAGWVGRGYRGFLPDVADELAGAYDVVSLFHCLEHTPDPRAEITAAYKVLEPGGLLVIEVPDPECAMGRVLGRFWFPWFQPQHLHLLSVKNLSTLLREVGFEPAIVQRGQAHLQVEFGTALMLVLSWLAPRLIAPWRRPPSRFERIKSHVVWFVGFAFVPVAMVLDAIGAAIFPRIGISNAYRVVARRDLRPVPSSNVALRVSATAAQAIEVA